MYVALRQQTAGGGESARFSGIFSKYQLDAIVYPTLAAPGDAHQADRAAQAHRRAPDSATSFANETGFPDLIVPAGVTKDGLPVTISFFGRAFEEPKLLGYGYDFEQATHALVHPKSTPALARRGHQVLSR